MRLSLDKITKTGLREMLEDALMRERDRSKPRHKRDGEKQEKDEIDQEADEEMEKLADLHEEHTGASKDVELDDEDMADDSLTDLNEESDKAKKKKPKKKTK
tara:strand:- start:403 stop:708 length:306 start_codon:yes stop_codon:yes gene_type:complete